MSSPADAVSPIVDPKVAAWIDTLFPDADPLLPAMEAFAAERGFPLVGRASGRCLELLTRLAGGRRVFEMGSGWGYSAFFFARAVGPEGEVLGAEKDAWELDHHRRLFAGHPLAARIRISQGDAIGLLARAPGTFDVVFIDVDKEGYPAALEAAVPRVRPGGLVIADNALWGGRVASPASDACTAAIRAFAGRLSRDPRLDALVLPVGDGLAVARVT